MQILLCEIFLDSLVFASDEYKNVTNCSYVYKKGVEKNIFT